MSTLNCMNTSKIIVLNGENDPENMIFLPVFVSINKQGVIRLSRNTDIKKHNHVEKKHHDWNILWYIADDTDQSNQFQKKIYDLLKTENKPPLIFIDKDGENLDDLNLIKKGYWENETLRAGFKINPKLASELNRLEALGVPTVKGSSKVSWMDNFNTVNEMLNSWVYSGVRNDKEKSFTFFEGIWKKGVEYYREH